MFWDKYKDYPFPLENAQNSFMFSMKCFFFFFRSDFPETLTNLLISTRAKWQMGEEDNSRAKSANSSKHLAVNDFPDPMQQLCHSKNLVHKLENTAIKSRLCIGTIDKQNSKKQLTEKNLKFRENRYGIYMHRYAYNWLFSFFEINYNIKNTREKDMT